MKSATMFERASTRTTSFNKMAIALMIVIALVVGVAMPFVMTFIETGSVDIFQDVFARRCISGGSSSASCNNVGTQTQTNSGNNAAGRQ